MGNLFDEYLAGFLGNLVYREAKKNFGFDGVGMLGTTNDCHCTPIQEASDYYLRQEVMKKDKLSPCGYAVIPWWAEVKASDGRAVHQECVMILQNKNKFYPLFYSWKNYFTKFENYLVVKYNMNYKKIPDKDRIDAYARVFERRLEDTKNKIFEMGHGKKRTIQGKTITNSVKTGTKTVSTPTGTYTLTGDAFRSNTYTLKENVTTKTVDTYKNVSHKEADKQFLDFCFWFTPETEKEKQRFLKVIENQEKIIKLADEYKRLGIFSGKRKKEILQTVNNMFEYAYLVVGQACYDRNKTFYDNDMKVVNELIEFANKNISELDEELNGIAVTAFEMRKEYKEPRKEWSKFLSELENLKNILPQKKELLISTLAGLDKRIDNHPAGCGSSK